MTSSLDSLSTNKVKLSTASTFERKALSPIRPAGPFFLHELAELSLPPREAFRERQRRREFIDNKFSDHSQKNKSQRNLRKHNPFPQGRRTWRRPGQLFHRGVVYASCHEAACGELMERYIPGFKVIAGKTFQIPILEPPTGKVRTIDFSVGGHFFEYHPPRFRSGRQRYGDFNGLDEYLRFQRRMHAARTKEEKHRLIQETRAMLALCYARKRREIIDEDPRFRGRPLITASCPAEFYDKVIRRFGEGYPPKEKFLNIFYAIVHEVFEKNKFLWRGGKYRPMPAGNELRRSA